DRGVPFVIEHSDTPAAKAFMEIVEKIKQAVEGEEDA
ncbi:ATP-binding protein, partial [Candidatus Bathyarchaeota archaeon]